VAGGGLLPMKGLDVDPKPLEGTVTVHKESTIIRSISPRHLARVVSASMPSHPVSSRRTC
jgi:hypothetical protein